MELIWHQVIFLVAIIALMSLWGYAQYKLGGYAKRRHWSFLSIVAHYTFWLPLGVGFFAALMLGLALVHEGVEVILGFFTHLGGEVHSAIM